VNSIFDIFGQTWPSDLFEEDSLRYSSIVRVESFGTVADSGKNILLGNNFPKETIYTILHNKE